MSMKVKSNLKLAYNQIIISNEFNSELAHKQIIILNKSDFEFSHNQIEFLYCFRTTS